MSIPHLALNDGHSLPAIGFGTYPLRGADGAGAIASALRAGYRLLDSAFNYENEGALGHAIRLSSIPRHELFITSKLPGRHHPYRLALASIQESLFRSRLDYFDLYLIHWPNPSRGLYLEAWQALVEARRGGLLRSIGVSNFLPSHLDHLAAATGVTPAVNQIELHPYFPQPELRATHAARGIVTQSWSPLARANSLLHEPALQTIAARQRRSVSQILLRWHIQLGALPLPKSADPDRQRENLAVFDFQLTPADLDSIATLARPDGRTFQQDPAFHEEL
jgi:diketogulonate reductase-like aldo/keto reductase